jgi:Nucleotidyl transferase AbiEii toxin, Type IV TA system
MNLDDQARWKNEALDEIFAALAARKTLTGYVVYKGARILNRRLADVTRQSLDIDMNMTVQFVTEYPTPAAQRAAFEHEIGAALQERFARARVVRYDVQRITVRASVEHALGWNAFEVLIGLRDFSRSSVRGLPTLQLDIAAPEELGSRSTAALAVDGHDVQAYTESRIAGEKLRAFLTTLPAYRVKLHAGSRAVRVKDLFDLVRIVRAHPLVDPRSHEFWIDAADDFRRACASRFVDCAGLATFTEGLDTTRATYDADVTIDKDAISFNLAWTTLEGIVLRLESLGVIPLRFPLPPTTSA